MADLSPELRLIHDAMLRGFDGINERLDELNGRVRTNENDIAVLKDRGIRKSDPAARWGAAFVGLAGVLTEIIRRMWAGSQ